MKILTEDFIHAYATKYVGWTKKQLACLGLKLPLKAGWIGRLHGTKISDEDCENFKLFSRRKFAKNPDRFPVWNKKKTITLVSEDKEEVTCLICGCPVNIHYKNLCFYCYKDLL